MRKLRLKFPEQEMRVKMFQITKITLYTKFQIFRLHLNKPQSYHHRSPQKSNKTRKNVFVKKFK